MADLTLKQGEAKTVTFTVTNAGAAVDLSGCTLAFAVRPKSGATAVITKTDANFDKAAAATGVVSVFLSSSDQDQQAGWYIGELKIIFPGDPAPVNKSSDLEIFIQQATTE